MKVRQLGTPAQIRHVARLWLSGAVGRGFIGDVGGGVVIEPVVSSSALGAMVTAVAALCVSGLLI